MHPSNIQLVNARLVKPQPWRNGGGQTRELLAWPPGADWKLRISRADIAADGPFSAFPQVQRWFAVLHGHGVELAFPDATWVHKRGDPPLCFDGAEAPACHLIDGPTQDLNLMVRHGQGAMRQVLPGRVWNERFAMRGLYTTTGGQWLAGKQACAVAPDTLLWAPASGIGEWAFEQHDRSAADCAWWLGFTPED